MDFLLPFLVILASAYFIKYASDQFEAAADFLGRLMPPGIKGATYNAIGSSMPELMTGLAFIFTISELEIAEGLMAAVAVTAGSAVFNIVIIPALVIVSVTFFGPKLKHVKIEKHTVIRDGAFLLIAELLLIFFLGLREITWWVSATLVATYFIYFYFLMDALKEGSKQQQCGTGGSGVEEIVFTTETMTYISPIKRLLTLDMLNTWFHGKLRSNGQAWALLGASVVIMGIACHFLAESIVDLAGVFSVPVYITSVILAAAATSVPDTILSVKDSNKGNHDDAVSNAIGSNIFDITVATGVPLLLYTVMFGTINLVISDELADQVQLLRLVLFGVSAAVLAMFLRTGKVGKPEAVTMLVMYVGWITWIIVSAM